MRELDQTDLEILRLLVEDARRPYNEIAERVDLSPPTVSDRVDRLRELGVIERFTLNLDRSLLADGVSVLVNLHVKPGHADDVQEAVTDVDAVEHVFRTADAHVYFQANLEQDAIRTMLSETIADGALHEYDVKLLADSVWNPEPDGVEFALECDECGNTVTSEGESLRLDGTLYQFCCSSCLGRFEEQYKSLREGSA